MADDPELAVRRPEAVAAVPLSFGLFALSRALHTYGTALLADLGLHPGQELIIMYLFDAEEASASEMIAELSLDHSTVSRSLVRMEKAGLITRSPSITDRRKVLARLTPRGLSLRRPLQDLWSAVEATVTAPLATGEQETLHGLALRVEDALTRARRISASV
ncbi:MarR family winged helix-turn-helix transcriptional regulator [Agreia sp.]|uniref:MarR family winged helix-turn-helix transcriptional regulator n=1 Tax=Agreia sp. TaxID=1872416 RepID=UPI0035BC8BE3